MSKRTSVSKVPTNEFKPEVSRNESISLDNISVQSEIQVEIEIPRKTVPSPSLNSQKSSAENRQQFIRNQNPQAEPSSFEMQRVDLKFPENSWDHNDGAEQVEEDKRDGFENSIRDLTGVSEIANETQVSRKGYPQEQLTASNAGTRSRPETEMISQIESLAETCDKGANVLSEALKRALEAEKKLHEHAERISEIENLVEENSNGLNQFQNVRVGFLEFLEK